MQCKHKNSNAYATDVYRAIFKQCTIFTHVKQPNNVCAPLSGAPSVCKAGVEDPDNDDEIAAFGLGDYGLGLVF